MNDAPVKGLRAVLDTVFSPNGKSPYGVQVSGGYKREYLNANASVDVLQGPTISTDVTVGTRELAFGAAVSFKDKPSYTLALTYAQPDYVVAFHARNQLQKLSLSYFHQVDVKLAAGAVATYSLDGKEGVAIEAGASYIIDKDASVKVRVNNEAKIGLGYSQRLRPGVKSTVGAVIDTNKGTTQLGLSLNLDA